MQRPTWLFDREHLFADLAGFADRDRSGLAIVRGRRRHGKSVLLRAVAEAGGHFYHQAVQGVPADQRRDLARGYARHFGGPEPRFDTWDDAVHALLHPPGRPGSVMIDEFPYLTDAAPELESVLQRALDAATPVTAPVVVCGSAVSVMTRLLVGAAPLRGRAQLELDVGPFDYRTARRFWNVTPQVALGVHAAIGGVPGYATELVDRTFPADATDLERWLVEVVASPRRPLVHEARSMLDVEPGIRDPATYLSVLGAIAHGATRVGEIAAHIGRSADAVSHALSALLALGLVARSEDVFGRGRPSYQVADPLLRLYAAVLRPHWEWVERGDPDRLAERIIEPWRARILGPHLEQLARVWARDHASADTLGGSAATVGWATVHDRARRVGHEVDLVALDDGGRVLALGEVKWRVLTDEDHERLRHVRGLLPGAETARLVLCSATGFSPGLAGTDAELVDVDRLYLGT
jgi:AAA+ ATPase superfamily predicted ATPase